MLQMLQSANQGNFTLGSRGESVWALQVFLIVNNLLTPTGPAATQLTNPTSYFGVHTQAALAEYQASASLTPAAGYFGPKTKNYLYARYLTSGASPAAAPPASPASTSQPFLKALRWGMHDPDVLRLQTFLAEDPAIYPEGKLTGYFGNATLTAVQRFQLKYNLAHDGDIFYGYVGAKTRAQLNQLIALGNTP